MVGHAVENTGDVGKSFHSLFIKWDSLYSFEDWWHLLSVAFLVQGRLLTKKSAHLVLKRIVYLVPVTTILAVSYLCCVLFCAAVRCPLHVVKHKRAESGKHI